jgi:nicotinate-nucleotide adenylyltransferase
MEKLGIFGGTFDPPHLGHLILASEAQHQLGLQRILWVLTPIPPHKPNKPITPLPDRYAMLERALKGAPAFELSTVEIARPPPHYAIDTLQILKEAFPGRQLVFLLGGDSLRDLPTWHQPRKFFLLLDRLGVMRRPNDVVDLPAIEAALPGISQKIDWIDAPLLEIASSDIRKRAVSGLPFRYFLPAEVYDYIQERGLYGAAA